MSRAIAHFRRREIAGLAAFLLLCAAVSAAGAWATAQSVGTWYQALAKPAFNPPDWIFAPVWTVLYVLIAVAGWRVWRAADRLPVAPALTAYAVQLALNLAWSFLFFGARLPGAALIEILLLLAAIVATIALFRPIDRPAAWLLAPYLAWVAFATALNFEVWRLN